MICGSYEKLNVCIYELIKKRIIYDRVCGIKIYLQCLGCDFLATPTGTMTQQQKLYLLPRTFVIQNRFERRECFKIALISFDQKANALNLSNNTINTNTDLILFNCITFYEVKLRIP